mmetsp:Transcript_20717/g.36967  ORF Transcript_20717/g.36967 Transcript_20717/m.36967 type:complete len:292 (-) Transcript_20717:299-1174(-)
MDSFSCEDAGLEVDALVLSMMEDVEALEVVDCCAADDVITAQGEHSVESLMDEDMQCAICLDTVPLAESAMIKGCDHLYCVGCILKWSLIKEDKVTCPKCKSSFHSVYTYRSLDGTLNDFPQEESVVLLQRAVWFEESLGNFKGKGVAPEPEFDIQDWLEEECFDEEEEIDDHYFMSSYGRRSRVAIGNRRWGSNGYIQAGRMAARPVEQVRPSKAQTRVSGKCGDINLEPPARGRRGCSSRGGGGGAADILGTSPTNVKEIPGLPPPEPSPAGKGRRARRARKRAQVDGS